MIHPSRQGSWRGVRQQGFSLLEVIVAMAIMAFSLGALYYAAGGGARGSYEAGQRTRATVLALSLLDSRSVVEAGGFDEQGEDAAGMRWRLRATPYPTGHEASPGWAMYRVEAIVGWGEGSHARILRLMTLLPQRAQIISEAR